MDTSSFLQTVLPVIGPIQEVYTARDGYVFFALQKTQNLRRTKPCYDIDSLVAQATGFSSLGWDAYFALGAFHTNDISRKAVDAYAFKAVWADIDVGKAASVYQTLEQAVAAVVRFAKQTGLTPTYIVKSGKGLHVYWAFTKTIGVAQWKTIARAFHCACVKYQLDVDPARAEDAASVLRVPGTLHQSSGNPVTILAKRSVWELKDFLGLLGKCVTVTELKSFQSTAGGGHGEMAPLSQADEQAMRDAGMLSDYDLHDPKPIVKGCKQIQHMGFATEPVWFRAMSVLRMCRKGFKLAHMLSALDKARYNYQQCTDKFYAAAYDHPCTCESFAQVSPGFCRVCPHRGHIKSPAQLDRLPSVEPVEIKPARPVEPVKPVVAPVVVEPVVEEEPEPTGGLAVPDLYAPLPDPPTAQLERNPQLNATPLALSTPMFSVTDTGIYYITQDIDPITGTMAATNHLMSTSRLYYMYGTTQVVDQRPHRCHVFRVVTPAGTKEDVVFDIERDYSAQSIMKWFANANIFPTQSCQKPSLFMSFMNAYLSAIAPENKAPSLKVCDHFGWNSFTDTETQMEAPAFVVGDGMVTHKGVLPVSHEARIERDAKSTFVSKGSLDMWKRLSNMYAVLHQPVGQLAVCLSFAAPLMRYALGEANSAVFSLWSDASGKGKTHVLRMAASVWGDPYAQFISRDASSVARTRKLTYLNNIPAFMDEMTDVSDEDMYGLAYTLTGGKEKDKLKSSGDAFVDTGNWSTVAFMTANRSVREAIARKAGTSEATLLRVMEYECDFRSYEDVPKINSYITTAIEQLKTNYGHAGPEFVYQLLKRPERLQTLSRVLGHWIEEHHFENRERFISNALGLAIIAGRWAVEFGLLDYDMDALEQWVLHDFVKQNRGAVQEFAQVGQELLNDYLSSTTDSMLVVAGVTRRQDSEPDPGRPGVPDKYVMAMPRTNVVRLRYCAREGRMYIHAPHLRTFLRQHSTTIKNVQGALEAAGVMVRRVSVSLTSGVSYMPTARVSCLMIERDGLEKLGFDMDQLSED